MPYTVIVVSTPDAGRINEHLTDAFVFRVLQGDAGVAGVPVTIAGTLGLTPDSPSIVSTAGGLVPVSVTLGRRTLAQTLTATIATANAQATVTPVGVPNGTIVPILNRARTAPSGGFRSGIPGHAAAAVAQSVPAFTAATDGTLYVATANCVLSKIDVDGTISDLGGLATQCQTGGDGGPVSAARFQPIIRLALNDSQSMLYILERTRLRRLDLTTMLVTTIAGGGTAGSSMNYGDGGQATNATLSAVDLVATDTEVVILDDQPLRLRRVDLASGLITREFTATPVGCGTGMTNAGTVVELQYWLAKFGPSTFFGGARCEAPAFNAAAGAVSPTRVVRRDGPNQFTNITRGGEAANGAALPPAVAGQSIHGRSLQFLAGGGRHGVAFGPLGDLLISHGNQLLRVDRRTSILSAVCGASSGPFNPEYSDCASTNFDGLLAPAPIATDGAGNVYFGSAAAGSVASGIFMVSGVATSNTPLSFAVTAGNGQSLLWGARTTAMDCTATSGGQPVANIRMESDSSDPGSGFYGLDGYTNASGVLSDTARVGMLSGPVTLQQRCFDLHRNQIGACTWNHTVNAPAVGTIFPIMNADRLRTDDLNTPAWDGPATIASPSPATHFAVLPDRRLVFAGRTYSGPATIIMSASGGLTPTVLPQYYAYASTPAGLVYGAGFVPGGGAIDRLDLTTVPATATRYAGGGTGPETPGVSSVGANLSLQPIWSGTGSRLYYQKFRYIEPGTLNVMDTPFSPPMMACSGVPGAGLEFDTTGSIRYGVGNLTGVPAWGLRRVWTTQPACNGVSTLAWVDSVTGAYTFRAVVPDVQEAVADAAGNIFFVSSTQIGGGTPINHLVYMLPVGSSTPVLLAGGGSSLSHFVDARTVDLSITPHLAVSPGGILFIHSVWSSAFVAIAGVQGVRYQ
ncbi:MAG: hypothetical protein JNJ54_31230 [Myxococcaceae bacterium]|nr:hypothetical protein [Myxococcaceae bacterium]